MNIERLILFLLIGIAAGWLANSLMKGKSKSLLSNLLVGCVGSIIGGYLARLTHLSISGIPLFDALLTAFLGALVLLLVIRFVK